MFIRTIIQAKTRKEAEDYLNNLLDFADTLNLKLSVINLKPFWKFDDSFHIEISGTEPTDEQLSKFLQGIASEWDRFSDSFLATRTLEGCTILLDNIEFIEIFNKDF